MNKDSNFEVLVDWDKTMFNTGEFVNDLWSEISKASQVDVDTVAKDGDSFHADPILGGYMFEDHVSKYGLDLESSWQMLEGMVSEKDYLYEGSDGFMANMVHYGLNPSILSFGERVYQMKKIAPYLGRLGKPDVRVVMERKGEFIARRFAGQRGVLIDDVPNQNLPEGFTEIHLDKQSGLKSPEVTGNVYRIGELSQALGIIGMLRREPLTLA